MAIRSTVHQTGGDAVTELLRFAPPDDDHRSLRCACGQTAQYVGTRSRPALTAVGLGQNPPCLLPLFDVQAGPVSRRCATRHR